MTISLTWRALPPGEVADFLASGQVKLANAYRVLNADGSIPDEGMLHCDLPRRGSAQSAGRRKASSSMQTDGLRKISG